MKNKYIIITLFILISVSVKSDWIQVSNGITQLNINDLTVAGNYIFAGTNVTVTGGGVFRSSNNGNSWEQVYFTTTLSLASFDSFVYRGYQNGFSYSSNYGSNWITPGGASKWINSMIALNGNVYIGVFTSSPTTNQGVWISSNNGANWTQTSLNNINIYTLSSSGINLYAGGYTFGIGGGVFKTTNNGQNWSNPLTIGGNSITSYDNFVYTGGGSSTGVYKSTNYGENWTQTSLNNNSIHALALYQGNIFAGGGFWVSTNQGTSWAERIEGMGNLNVNAISIFNGYIYVGTDGNGVWRRPLSEVVSIKTISTNIPLKYELYQNYPNPFNPITKIKFNVPQRSFIQIIIYDILGRKKENLVNQELSASEYETLFNGSDYSSGVYFYQLISNGKNIDTKKFIISK